jgi:hypothetical protein
MPEAIDAACFEQDLIELKAQPLRRKYPGEASSHANMKRRCLSGNFELDPAWNDFRDFLRDMGPRPSAEATLDRVDPDVARYGPGLVRWASKQEQTVNRRNTRWVDFEGRRMTLQQFADHVERPYSTVHSALERGVAPEEIYRRNRPSQFSYCPPRYEGDPVGLADWYARFEKWKKLARSDRRALATPEVWDIVGVSLALGQAETWLGRKGLYELAPDDDAFREELLASRQGWIWRSAPGWIDQAISALAAKDPKLAQRFRKAAGWTYPDFHRFQLWLTQPHSDHR